MLCKMDAFGSRASSAGQMKSGEIHVWSGRLTASDDRILHFYLTLSAEEKERAKTFRFEQHRKAYITSRGLLRSILASYQRLCPETISFEYGSKGKPYLKRGYAPSLYFNLAHADEFGLYGFCQNSEIGVDLERVREIPDAEVIAKRLFTHREHIELLSLPSEVRTKAFLYCWTRKEAFIKATGEGLSLPLNTFEVSLHSERTPTLRILNHVKQSTFRWRLINLEPAEGYVAAIAHPLLTYSLKEWKFNNVEECLDRLKNGVTRKPAVVKPQGRAENW
jgi:4'-phosphopantetheinyl transferase